MSFDLQDQDNTLRNDVEQENEILMNYTLYLKVRNRREDQDTEPFLYFCIENCKGFLDVPNKPLQFSEFVWKEDSTGVKVIKDRFGGCIRYIFTEDEHKEFMWVKLRSQTYNGQI